VLQMPQLRGLARRQTPNRFLQRNSVVSVIPCFFATWVTDVPSRSLSRTIATICSSVKPALSHAGSSSDRSYPAIIRGSKNGGTLDGGDSTRDHSGSDLDRRRCDRDGVLRLRARSWNRQSLIGRVGHEGRQAPPRA
jgi:hypothetical protein